MMRRSAPPKARHVAHRAEAEAVVVDPGAGADHRPWSRRPGDAQARAEVVVVLELRVIVPAQPDVHHQLVGQLPVVLQIDRGVVVAQADLGGLVGETAGRDQGEEAGVDGAEAVEVLLGGEQLVAHHPELVAVDLGAQELDAALDVVLAQRTQHAGAERAVLLVDLRVGGARAEVDRAEIAEEAEGRGGAEDVERRQRTGLGVRREGEVRVVAVLEIAVEDPGVRAVAEHRGVAQAEHGALTLEGAPCRGQAGGQGQRQEVGEILLGPAERLGEPVAGADLLVEAREQPGLLVVGGLVERVLEVADRLRRSRREREVELAILVDVLRRGEHEDAIPEQRAADVRRQVQAVELRRILAVLQAVRGVERIVAPEPGGHGAPVVLAALGDDVDRRRRCRARTRPCSRR